MAASGPLSLNLTAIGNLLAACSSWQTWTDAADATEAATFIFQGEVDGDVARPVAIIDVAETGGLAWERTTASSAPVYTGAATIVFLADFDDSASYATERETFFNRIGGVISELMLKSATLATVSGNRVPHLRGGRLDGPLLYDDRGREVASDDKDTARGGYWWAGVTMDWGVR